MGQEGGRGSSSSFCSWPCPEACFSLRIRERSQNKLSTALKGCRTGCREMWVRSLLRHWLAVGSWKRLGHSLLICKMVRLEQTHVSQPFASPVPLAPLLFYPRTITYCFSFNQSLFFTSNILRKEILCHCREMEKHYWLP